MKLLIESTDEDVLHQNICCLVNTIPVFYLFTISKRPNLISKDF